jgi:hypothetical protein
MAECKLCDKEQSILSVTGIQIPVGEKCYTKLVDKNVVWDSETKLKRMEEMLKIG